MDFPRFVYQSPGPVRSGGACYRYTVVKSHEEMKTHLATGWFETEVEAIVEAGDEAYLHGLPPLRKARVKKMLAKRPKKPAKDKEPELVEGPPTRQEMEEMAEKLGVRFDGRTSDALLSKRIENALRHR